MLFYKIRRHGRNFVEKPYWVKSSVNEFGEIWVNLHGGWCMKFKDDEILEVADYPDEDSFIDHYRKDIYSYLIKSNSDLGWLSPSGDFYGCDYAKHDELTNLYFNKTDMEMEKEGWVKIFRSVESGKPAYYSKWLSLQQRVWIDDHGVEFSY